MQEALDLCHRFRRHAQLSCLRRHVAFQRRPSEILTKPSVRVVLTDAFIDSLPNAVERFTESVENLVNYKLS
jgi:hypothetical protein